MNQLKTIEIMGLFLFFLPLFWVMLKVSEWWQAVLALSMMLCGFRFYLYKKVDKIEVNNK